MFCRLCNYTLSDRLFEAQATTGESIAIHLCLRCGVLFPDFPVVIAQDSLEALEDQTTFHENWWRDFSAADAATLRKDLRNLVQSLRPFLLDLSTSTIVDIGAGRGGLLAALKDEGYRISGCEPSVKLVDLARDRYNLSSDELYNLETSDFCSLARDQKFRVGAIFLWHVLEHLSSPLKDLADAVELLIPGGKIFVQVPTYRQDYLYRQHYLFFTEKAFSYLAKVLNLSIESIVYDHERGFTSIIFFAKIDRSAPIPEPAGNLSNTDPNITEGLLKGKDSALEEARFLATARFQEMKKMDLMIRERDVNIARLYDEVALAKALAQQRLTAINEQSARIEEKVAEVAAQRRLIEERFTAIQMMNQMVQERDALIERMRAELDAASNLALERFSVMKGMDSMILERDETIKSTKLDLEAAAKLARERFQAIQEIEQLVKDRDYEIAQLRIDSEAARKLALDRYASLSQQSETIRERDDKIQGLTRELLGQSQAFKELILDRDKLALDLKNLSLQYEKLVSDRDKLALELEKLSLESVKLLSERDKVVVECAKLTLEISNIRSTWYFRFLRKTGLIPR